MAESHKYSPAEAERGVLAWLILAFRPPSPDAVEQLAGVDPTALLLSAGLSSVQVPPIEDPVALAKELAPEYVRLFVNRPGGDAAYPEAVAHLDHADPAAVEGWLRSLATALSEAGLEPDPASPQPADHLTVLLEFLYAQSVSGDIRGGKSPFAERFLVPWLPRFLNRLRALEPHPFYARAGEMLASVLLPDS